MSTTIVYSKYLDDKINAVAAATEERLAEAESKLAELTRLVKALYAAMEVYEADNATQIVPNEMVLDS